MATALVDDEASLQCGICCENYDQNRLPKFLTCYHTFCTQCLATCAKDATIQCPFCRQMTQIDKGVSCLTTNFYILPKMSSATTERKQPIKLLENCQINWAQSITYRREAQTRLNMVHDSLRLLESRIIQQMEENNEKIGILQSLMDKPSEKSEKLSKREERELELQLKQSEMEVTEAKDFQADLASVEAFSCQVALKNATEGSSYRLKFLEDKLLSFENSSQHGPCIGAAMSTLAMILRLTKDSNLWEPFVDEVFSQPAVNPVRSQDTVVRRESPVSTSPLLGLLSALQNRLPDYCYIQFSVKGVLKKKIVIKLEHELAPEMCSHFFKYCDGTNHLTYENTPIRLTNPGISITAGQYVDLNWNGDGMEEVVSDDEDIYLADWSPLSERRGAVRMRHRGKCVDGVLVSSEFSIICDHRREEFGHGHGHGVTTVFAYVTDGIEVCEEISHLNPVRNDIFIARSGSWLAPRN